MLFFKKTDLKGLGVRLRLINKPKSKEELLFLYGQNDLLIDLYIRFTKLKRFKDDYVKDDRISEANSIIEILRKNTNQEGIRNIIMYYNVNANEKLSLMERLKFIKRFDDISYYYDAISAEINQVLVRDTKISDLYDVVCSITGLAHGVYTKNLLYWLGIYSTSHKDQAKELLEKGRLDELYSVVNKKGLEDILIYFYNETVSEIDKVYSPIVKNQLNNILSNEIFKINSEHLLAEKTAIVIPNVEIPKTEMAKDIRNLILQDSNTWGCEYCGSRHNISLYNCSNCGASRMTSNVHNVSVFDK